MTKKPSRDVSHAFLVRTGLTILGGTVVLSACTTYEDKYARLYDACDKRAGVCYQQCDTYRYEDDRRRCQSDCSYEADRCFGDISELASQESAYYASRNNFYGRYGAWYPSSGYRYGPHGYPYTYNYGYGGYSGYGGSGGYGGSYDNDDREEYDNSNAPERSTGKPNNPNPKSLPRLPAGEPPIRPSGKPNTPTKPPVTSPPKPVKPKPAPSKPKPKPSKPKPTKPAAKPTTPPKQPD